MLPKAHKANVYNTNHMLTFLLPDTGICFPTDAHGWDWPITRTRDWTPVYVLYAI